MIRTIGKSLCFFYCLLLLADTSVGQTGASKQVRLTLALVSEKFHPLNPEDAPRLHLLRLVIINNTDSNASFYKPSNLWGDDAIRFELRIKDTLYTLHYASACDSRYFPGAQTLHPGDSITINLQVRKCTELGPCPCVYSYSLLKGHRFPENNLRGATIRAIYQVNLENHQLLVDFEKENAKGMNKKRQKETTVYLNSFVTAQLVSEPIILDIDSW